MSETAVLGGGRRGNEQGHPERSGSRAVFPEVPCRVLFSEQESSQALFRLRVHAEGAAVS